MLTISITVRKISSVGGVVGGDMVIFSFHVKMAISPPTHIFGALIDIVTIFYHTKNQVGGLCVGGVSIQPGDLPQTPLFVKKLVYFQKCFL